MKRPDCDDGAIAVLCAILVAFVLVPVAAITVDLSAAYQNRRVVQNAADSASMAGARQLDKIHFNGEERSTLEERVIDIATENSIDTSRSDFSCEVLQVTYDPTTPPYYSVTDSATCDSEDWTIGDAAWRAVRVDTGRDIKTAFAGALGLLGGTGYNTTSANAKATAAIQRLATGFAPFALCYQGQTDQLLGSAAPNLMTSSPSPWTINPAAIGATYLVWSNGGGASDLSRCGLKGKSWNGRVCSDKHSSGKDCSEPIRLPYVDDSTTDPVYAVPGAKVGPTLTLVAGQPGCAPEDLDTTGTPTFAPCVVALPICYAGAPSTGGTEDLHCALWGAFRLSPGSGKSIYGEFLGAATVIIGSGGTEVVQENDTRRIALIN